MQKNMQIRSDYKKPPTVLQQQKLNQSVDQLSASPSGQLASKSQLQQVIAQSESAAPTEKAGGKKPFMSVNRTQLEVSNPYTNGKPIQIK